MSFPASSDLFKFNNRNRKKKDIKYVHDKDTRAMSMTSIWCLYC